MWKKKFFLVRPEAEDEIQELTQPGVIQMRKLVFSRKGQYMAVIANKHHLYVYNTENWNFHAPFRAPPGTYIQGIRFHPTRPRIIVSTQRLIYIYDVSNRTQKMDTLKSTAQWISSIDLHPRGNHILAGSYDGKSYWFDVELRNTPYKILREHFDENGIIPVRHVSIHRRFPLFATAHDDGKIDVYHGKVFNDLITNPLIIPVKELTGHVHPDGSKGVYCLAWHPKQPWLASGGNDHSIRLWT